MHLNSNYILNENEYYLNESTIDLLNNQLDAADYNLIPKLKKDSAGKLIYTYKKLKFQSPLSLSDIEELVNNPPSFETERLYIKNIINLLHKLDINLIIVNFKNDEIAGQWIPKNKVVKLNKKIIESGTKNFSIILNHEVIHIAQSCRNGDVRKNPKLIGLNLKINVEKKYLLSSKIYNKITNRELKLEKEAYSYQDDLILGAQLIKKYCL